MNTSLSAFSLKEGIRHPVYKRIRRLYWRLQRGAESNMALSKSLYMARQNMRLDTSAVIAFRQAIMGLMPDYLSSGSNQDRYANVFGWHVEIQPSRDFWSVDPISNVRYELETTIGNTKLSSGKYGEDILALLEIGRMQYLPTITEARLDGSMIDFYSKAIFSFIRWNPLSRGVHWKVPMEVGIRGLSILLFLAFHIKEMDQTIIDLCTRVLWAHYCYLYYMGVRHWVSIRHNHYLAQLALSSILARVFHVPHRSFVLRGIDRSLGREVIRQFRVDGGPIEGSLSYGYQNYIALMMAIYISHIVDNKPLRRILGDGPIAHRVAAAIDFNKHIDLLVNRHDVGDNCDTSIIRPLGIGTWPPSRPRLNTSWLHEPSANITNATVFPNSGLCTMKRGRFTLEAYALPVGDISGHAHQDWGSMKLSVDNNDVLTDSGTYSYHRDINKRLYYRSYRAHSTCIVDDNPPAAQLHSSKFSRLGRLDTEISGYNRYYTGTEPFTASCNYSLGQSNILQTRQFCLTEEGLTIYDIVDGAGTHGISIRFVLSPSVDIYEFKSHEGYLAIHINDISLKMILPREMHIRIERNPLSISYLRETETYHVVAESQAVLPFSGRSRIIYAKEATYG